MKNLTLTFIGFFVFLSAECLSQNPEYLGAGSIDLEQVPFGINVPKFYSKALEYSPSVHQKAGKEQRYYIRNLEQCTTWEGDETVLENFWSLDTDYNDNLAHFGKFTFPSIQMLANSKGRLVGIAADKCLTNPTEVDALLFALADKYGNECTTIDAPFGGKIFSWKTKRATVSLCVEAPDPDETDAILPLTNKENDMKQRNGEVNGCKERYEVVLAVTVPKYDSSITGFTTNSWARLCSGYYNKTIDREGVYDIGPLITEQQLTPTGNEDGMTIPDGTMPRIKEEPYDTIPDFRRALSHYVTTRISKWVEFPRSGSSTIIFTIDKKGHVCNPRIKDEALLSDEQRLAVRTILQRLPDFEPATQHGEPVMFRMSLPLQF